MGKWPSLDKIELKNGSIGDKEYVRELRKLQHQLLDLQIHHHQTGGRVVIGIDGWDAAGKGGAFKIECASFHSASLLRARDHQRMINSLR